MATIDANPSSPTMNCYVDLDFADAYFDARFDFYDDSDLGNQTWASFDPIKKTALLISATNDLESFNFGGLKTIRTQPLKWPRQALFDFEAIPVDKLTVPNKIKQATCELAYWKFREGDRTADDYTQAQLESMKVGPLDIKMNPTARRFPQKVLDYINGIGPGIIITGGGTAARRIIL